MPKINVDFSQLPPEYMPAGTYQASVVSVELKESQTSEYPYLNWRMEIIDGEHTGRNVYLMTSLSPKALFGLRGALKAFGYSPDAISELDVEEGTNLLVNPVVTNIPIWIDVSVETYQEVARNKVKKIIALVEDGGYDVDEDEKADEVDSIDEPDSAPAVTPRRGRKSGADETPLPVSEEGELA